MDEKGISFEQAMKELAVAHKEDYLFEGGRILGSMCTTPREGSVNAHAMFIESNLGNPGLYPGTKKLEKEVISMLSDLLHGKNLHGQMMAGGTEGNITAAWIARNVTGKDEVVFCENVHFSMNKACELLRMKPVVVGLNENYEMDVEDARSKITENTAVVVASAGSTELGVVDPIKELSEICQDNVFLHVDASFGGFVIPFLRELGYSTKPFDFEVDGVSSIVLDGHKMGMATIPSGMFLLRREEDIRTIAVESPYLTSVYQTSLLGTRCSAGVASLYFSMKVLGKEGYRNVVKDCMDNTSYLVSEVRRIGLDVPIEPVTNICGILVKEPSEIREEMDRRNWKVSLSAHPPCLRVVVMPHVKKPIIDSFVQDLEEVCRQKGEL